ncbi:MAG: DUF3466 family protein [Vibrio sp.]
MSRITFKRSILATAVILATQTANAALYQVMEVTPSTGQSYGSAWGVAIQASNPDAIESCFTSETIDTDSPNETACDNFALAGETRIEKASAGKAVDGLSYRDEVAFGIDNAFIYIKDWDDFESYCYNQLGYAICETWVAPYWNRWADEINGRQLTNSIAFVGTGTSATLVDETKNIVINSLTAEAKPVGISIDTGKVTAYRRDSINAHLPANISAPNLDGALYTRAWKTDDTYTVGSVSRTANNDEGDFFTSKAAIWKNNGGTPVELSWGENVGAKHNNRLSQGSLRDLISDGTQIYAVGYNTYDNDHSYMQASIFQLDANLGSSKTTVVVGATAEIGDDYVHSNSVVTDVNKNLLALGEAKRAGSRPENGAAANRLFVVNDVKAPVATFLTGGIFFTGAGGKAGAINNYNEIVGQIDAENTRETDGKPRRKRGFIYPHSANGSDQSRMAIFSNKAWWLDDLTNDGSVTGINNQFRIIDAADINDAGVIAATALKCEGGYDTTAHNALCGGGDRDETVVAVKLVPIPNATSSNIEQRITEQQVSERKGAGLGFGLLLVLGWLGLRRK